MSPVTRILVVDDEELVRSGICFIVSSLPNIEVVGATGSGKEAIILYEQLQPDLVLLDLKMEDLNGVEVASALLNKYPNIKIIILTALINSAVIAKLFKLGIAGFLNKSSGFKEIAQAIQAVSAGHFYTQCTIDRKFKRGKYEVENPLDILSERELQVALLIYYGWKSECICEELEISSSTLKTYCSRLYRKLYVKNPVELAVLMHRFGLLAEDGTLL